MEGGSRDTTGSVECHDRVRSLVTCYLRLHEVAVAVHGDVAGSDWAQAHGRWLRADGVAGRDAVFDAMPVTLIELDDLAAADLTPFAGVVLSGRSDQELLAARGDDITAFLRRGRVIVYSGQLTGDWLPGVTPFERHEQAPAGAAELAEHPVLAGVDPADLGASFLYRDGWHRVPEGAEVLAHRSDGTPGAWVARAAGGTVLVHSGANLLANAVLDSSAARIVPQLLAWIGATAAR